MGKGELLFFEILLIFYTLKIIYDYTTGLEGMTKCNLTAVSNEVIGHGNYDLLFHEGVCCDFGRTEKWTVDIINRLKSPINELCDL